MTNSSTLRLSFKWLLYPVYFTQLFTGAKSFEANPLIGSQRLNAMGLHKARVALAYRCTEARRARLGSLVSADDRSAFERDGFVVKRDFLPPVEFERLLAEIKAYKGLSEEREWGETVNRKYILDSATTAKMPAVGKVINSRDWRNLIAYVGGCASTPLFYIQTLIRRGGEVDPQTHLHLDTFHSTCKAWLFLTDVRPNEGAFTYVPGSHRLTQQKLEWLHKQSLEAARCGDKETREGSFRIKASDLPALNLPQPVKLAVPANTLVVADTSGIHARGPSKPNTMRVEIWALGRRQPFLTWGGVEPWTSEVLASFVRLAESFRKNSPWKKRSGASAFDV